MATIVENIESKKRFVLIGSSFSYFKEVSEHRFLKFLRNTEEGEFEVITISDENGEYSITVPSNRELSIVFSSIGFEQANQLLQHQ